MNLKTYKDLSIKLLWRTPDLNGAVKLACDTTMLANPLEQEFRGNMSALIRFLISAEHTNPLEHCVFSFYLQNISRSFLAQITRQRMASPTSGSQHYQDYRDYPCVVHPEWRSTIEEPYLVYEGSNSEPLNALEVAYLEYSRLSDEEKMPKEEARQVMPNGAAVNFIWTVNAVTLYWFIRKRICNRNVAEMRHFAAELQYLVRIHWPEFADVLGAPCETDGSGCNQGFMQCKQEYRVPPF